MPLGMNEVLGPGDFVFDGDPAVPEKKAQPPPNFWLMSIVTKRLHGWMKTPLRTEVDLGPGHIVLDGNPAPPRKGHSSLPSFGPCLLWLRSPISATAELMCIMLMATRRQ